MFRILLADDEGIMLESLKKIITTSFGSECDIRCVKTGRGVVEMAESFHPDIAFVDIHMPGSAESRPSRKYARWIRR
jgi:two-component system response regulator YesN